MDWFLLLAFVALLAWETFQLGRAFLTKRVRRITFRPLYVTAEEDSWGFWSATVYHAFAALFLAWMAFLWAQQPGLIK